MSHVFPRHTRTKPPTVASGSGVWLTDTTGKRYLDASGGAAVSSLGHSAQPVLDAVKGQLDQIAYAHTGFFTSEPAERLADRLAARAPGNLDRVYFVSGGSEAVEAALKLARQVHVERGEPERRHIVARWQSYHGNTLGALAAGGNRWRRTQFEPLLTDAVHHVSPCHHWRWGEPGETPEAYGARLIAEAEALFQRLGPETVAAFIAEPVVGATMGAVPAVPGYFAGLRALCDRYGVLMILDEVMCGMGRTGHWFACEEDGVVPDMVCIAKGLGAGVQPIGALLCTDAIYTTIAEGTGFFQHGHTYLGHPAACAAGNAVLDEIEDKNLLAAVTERGALLQETLEARFGQDPNVGDIRGRGLFRGIELVEDRETKAPLDPERRVAARIKAAAFEAGLMVYPMAGTIDGHRGDHVLIAPPFIVSEDEITVIADRLEYALTTALAA